MWYVRHYDDTKCVVCLSTPLQPVLILSEGKSILKVGVRGVNWVAGGSPVLSVLQVDCHVPLQPSTSANGRNTSLDDISAELQQYLTLCRGLEYTLTPPMQAVSASCCIHALISVYTACRPWRRSLSACVEVTPSWVGRGSTTCCAWGDWWPSVMAALPWTLTFGTTPARYTKTDLKESRTLGHKNSSD